jgi:hypothetical protein
MKYRKKQLVVEAIQWNGNSNKQEIDAFVGRDLKMELESDTAYLAGKGAPIFSLLIETKEGIMKAFKGDWIIKEPFPTGDRDFYPCKNDIFINTYESVPPVAQVIGKDGSISLLNWIATNRGTMLLSEECKQENTEIVDEYLSAHPLQEKPSDEDIKGYAKSFPGNSGSFVVDNAITAGFIEGAKAMRDNKIPVKKG